MRSLFRWITVVGLAIGLRPVGAQTVASVRVSQSRYVVATGDSVQATCTAYTSGFGTVSGLVKTWSTSGPQLTVSSAGMVKGIAPGTADVACRVTQASGNSVTGSRSTVDTARTVTPPPQTVTSVVVTPATASIAIGGTQAFSAQPRCGAANCTAAVTWTTSAPSVATVSGTGVATGVAAGSVAVVATASGVPGSATLAVSAPVPPTVASIVITPSSLALGAGATGQLSASARTSGGVTIPNEPITWSSSAPSVATVSSTGLVAGVGAGSASVTAAAGNGVSSVAAITVAAAPPPDTTTPPVAGTPNPLALPVATTAVPWNRTAYTALNVGSMSAGGTYRDPVTNVRVTKLTSASFPASGQWTHDYFEGGNEISNPIDSTGKRYVLTMNGAGSWYVITWTPGVGVSQPRAVSGAADPNADNAFTFSVNPATPYYAYVLNGTALRRIDVRTMTEAVGGGFPLTGTGSGVWLQQCANDAEFVWMAGSVFHHYTPAAGRHITTTISGANEPRFSRGCRYVGISMDSPENGLRWWDAQSNTVGASTSGDKPFAHNALLSGVAVGSDWNSNYPFHFTSVVAPSTTFAVEGGSVSVGDTPLGNGQWIQAGDQRNAWTVWNSSSGTNGCGSFCGGSYTWVGPGGIVLVTLNGERRVLAHPYSNQSASDYWGQAWAKFSADGKMVIFTSNQLGSRHDLFVIELPLKP